MLTMIAEFVCWQEFEDGTHENWVNEGPCGGRVLYDDVVGVSCGNSLVEAERSESRLHIFHGRQELGGVIIGTMVWIQLVATCWLLATLTRTSFGTVTETVIP